MHLRYNKFHCQKSENELKSKNGLFLIFKKLVDDLNNSFKNQIKRKVNKCLR